MRACSTARLVLCQMVVPCTVISVEYRTVLIVDNIHGAMFAAFGRYRGHVAAFPKCRAKILG